MRHSRRTANLDGGNGTGSGRWACRSPYRTPALRWRGGAGTVGLNPLLVDGGNILLLWGLWEVGNRWWSRRKAREDE